MTSSSYLIFDVYVRWDLSIVYVIIQLVRILVSCWSILGLWLIFWFWFRLILGLGFRLRFWLIFWFRFGFIFWFWFIFWFGFWFIFWFGFWFRYFLAWWRTFDWFPRSRGWGMLFLYFPLETSQFVSHSRCDITTLSKREYK